MIIGETIVNHFSLESYLPSLLRPEIWSLVTTESSLNEPASRLRSVSIVDPYRVSFKRCAFNASTAELNVLPRAVERERAVYCWLFAVCCCCWPAP